MTPMEAEYRALREAVNNVDNGLRPYLSPELTERQEIAQLFQEISRPPWAQRKEHLAERTW